MSILKQMQDRNGLNNEQSLISVIVPVFNVEKYIEECLDSVLGQTWQNFEVLLVDDGSTDASGKKCDEYAAKDARFRVWHTANSGIGNARNLALDNAKGSFVFFLDPDDVLESFSLSYLFDCIKRFDADIAMGVSLDFNCSWDERQLTPRAVFGKAPEGYAEYVYSTKREIIEEVIFDKGDFKPLETRNQPQKVDFQFFSTLYKTTILKDNEIEFLTINYGEDTYVLVKHLLFSSCVVVSSLPVYWHRRNPTSVSFRYLPNFLPETKTYCRCYRKLFEDSAPEYLNRFEQGLQGTYFYRCVSAIERELTNSPEDKTLTESARTLKEIRTDDVFRRMFKLTNFKYMPAGKMKGLFLMVKAHCYSLPLYLMSKRG